MLLPVVNQIVNTDDWSPSQREEIARELASAIEGEVRFGLQDRMLYATDASMYQVEPLGVVIPASIEDAVRAVQFCAKHHLPILPRGGGTSLAGQCTNRAVVIDFSANCRGLLEVDVPGRRVRTEIGTTIDDLNDALASTGLFFAPDPATSKHANIGGAIGNNAAGGRSVRYGRTSESLISATVALADGTVVKLEKGAALKDPRVGAITEQVARIVQRNAKLIKERFPKTIRRNAGYALDMILAQLEQPWTTSPLENVNLAHLVCGSEGTLAVTLEAELALHPKPKARGIAVISFVTLEDAIAAVKPILDVGMPMGLTAIEMLDDVVLDAARGNLEYRSYVDMLPGANAQLREPKAVLYVEFFGFNGVQDVQHSFDRLEQLVAQLKGVMPNGFARHTDPAAMLKAWKLRKAGEPLLHGLPGKRKPVTFVEDNAVPVENLGEFVRRFKEIVARHGTRAAYWAHASVGVLHIRPMVDLHSDADRKMMQAIAVESADLAREMGGVMSGEHGDGRVRGPLLERYFGPELMEAMREVKAVFDPENRLNPGNIIEPRPISSINEKLRIEPLGAPVHVPKVETYFDYAAQDGFDHAVEMCNGAGVCRKKTGGTMCPSYMATLDERHSTRGRGNALRLAITGQLSPSGQPAWNDAETEETLNLCLSCKACKSECPTNVDIAKLKAEYSAQKFKLDGPSLKALAFGNVRLLNRLGSMTAPIANAVNASWLGKFLASTIMGIDPRRRVPAFAASLASKWGTSPAKQKKVALFGDCFVMYNEPGIGLASKKVLEACGYEILLADAGCCGRAKISTGLLEQAIEEIDSTLERLRPLIEDESITAILVAEPSCLSAMQDDWLSLKLRTPLTLRNALKNKTFLVEDFVERYWSKHPTTPMFTAGPTPVLHGHCHQKALWGNETSAALLRRVAGNVEVLDTGCCGMAGSFGYTKDRYELSMQIGELTLFPAVRKSGEKQVCAPGTSCRHQIHDGTGSNALHPIEFAASRLT